jgi:hypothetical protein
MEFPELYKKACSIEPPETLVALDPGETTGYALFKHGILTDTRELPTHRIDCSVDLINNVLTPNTMVVYENYKVYAWKADSHSWDNLHTPRLIGCIQTLCYLKGLHTHSQMAQQAKHFCTDTKLQSWGYYPKGLRHARDAIRHGCFFLLFNWEKVSKLPPPKRTLE